MIAFSLLGMVAILYIALVRGHVVEFLYRVGLFLGAVAGAIFDIMHHLCMDVREVFKRKEKPVKLDEYEEDIS
jgi:hypothetical protein